MSASDILRINQLAFSKYTVRLSAAYDSTPPKKYKVDKHKIIKKHKKTLTKKQECGLDLLANVIYKMLNK